MSKTWMCLLFLMSINRMIDGSYRYVGCYTHVFYESSFSSSLMEPTLCFRLCDTPIIYLQDRICRCSGGGLMHHDKQSDQLCSFNCTKPVDRQVKTANTCGGPRTYSAYVEEEFYIRHGHLLNYQIKFLSCELWRTNGIYQTIQVDMDSIGTTSSLNRLERCAAACLDRNITTKSIAFHRGDDENQCLCILPSNSAFQQFKQYLSILPNSSCNRYCNNTSEGSTVEHLFQCGALNDTRVWAIYNLNSTCPANHVYIKEFQKCLYAYKNFWNSCPPPSKSYVYDGRNTWDDFLKMIQTLKLNESLVTVNFDPHTIVNSSWKCSKTAADSYSSSRSWDPSTQLILDEGCLREISYSSYAHRYSYRLCIVNPLNKDSSSLKNATNATSMGSSTPLLKYCPTNWFDLNGRCYRMTDEKKTIRNARNNCMTISKSPVTNDIDAIHNDINIDYYDDDDQLDDAPKGEIVQYTSEWQARLGFFLLDTISDTDLPSAISSTPSDNLYYVDLLSLDSIAPVDQGNINDFQMINPMENKNVSLNDGSCVITSRKSFETGERPVLESISQKDCSTPKHVLCETNTLIVREYQQGCFRKPLFLDLPALISPLLSYELCLSVCKELQTRLAILHVDKCYCLMTPKALNLTASLAKYQTKDCGDLCPGNQHERCGDNDTIVAFQILDSRRTFSDISTPTQPYPDFLYESCLQISLNSSTIDQFYLKDIHPRHCLEFCANHQQTYALINANKCSCTNMEIKNGPAAVMLSHLDCSFKCPGNYFYTCGSNENETIYSTYVMKSRCVHGYEVAKNNQQCVYTNLSVAKESFSKAESYCRSLGGQLARINDILEIQNLFPNSISSSGLLKSKPFSFYMKSANTTKYFWLDRSSTLPDDNTTIILGSLPKCARVSEKTDRNCLVIHHEPHTTFSSFNITISKLCIAESDQCANVSATPICVNKNMESKVKSVDSMRTISSNVTIGYSCGDDHHYHFIDNYCYKIKFHEIGWIDAKAECQQENATIFVPEKFITLQMIKSLFLRKRGYTSSGFAHIGVMYDYRNRTVIQHNTIHGDQRQIVPDSSVIYDRCEKTFRDRYTAFSLNEQTQLKTQRIGCGYIDLLSYIDLIIQCDEIPCNRNATVICQKPPIVITAERESSISSTDESSGMSMQESTKSIGRDFAPIFFILATFFALILLGFLSALYNHRFDQKNNSRRNNNSFYSQLRTANEIDLT